MAVHPDPGPSHKRGALNDPGSAAHHFVLRRAQEMWIGLRAARRPETEKAAGPATYGGITAPHAKLPEMAYV
jgi:hypothetical protein